MLASYSYGMARLGDDSDLIWGDIPPAWRSFYTANMLAAAAGYFPFTGFLLFGVDSESARVGRRFRFGIFHALYAIILSGSALWLPLTCLWIERGGKTLWALIHLDLLAVGFGSLGLLAAILTLEARRLTWAHKLAIAGVVPFFVQTAILDALVWPAYFPH